MLLAHPNPSAYINMKQRIVFIKITCSFLLLLQAALTHCQEIPKGLIGQVYTGNGMVPSEEGRYYLPAYKHVSVFSKAYALSDVVYKTQSFADSLLVTDILEEQYVKHKNTYSYWCKVSYMQNGKRGTGYVPGQLLAPLVTKSGSKTYMVILERYEQQQFFFALKILNNYELVHQHSFTAPSQDGYFPFEKDTGSAFFSGDATLELFNNRGLKKVDHVLRISSGVAACGYWNGARLFLLSGDAIKQTLEEGSVGDADIYGHSEVYLFPMDSLGRKKHLIKQVNNYEMLNDELAEEWESRTTYKFKKYRLIPRDSVGHRRTIKITPITE